MNHVYRSLSELRSDSYDVFKSRCKSIDHSDAALKQLFTYKISICFGGSDVVEVYYCEEKDAYYLRRTKTITERLGNAGSSLIIDRYFDAAAYCEATYQTVNEMAAENNICLDEILKSQEE